MPMRVGEMMVIIRAEDFASRTLRRVGGEFRQLSRTQAMHARASQRFAGNKEELRRLDIMKKHADALRTVSDLERRREAASVAHRARISRGVRLNELAEIQARHGVAMRGLDSQLAAANKQLSFMDSIVAGLPARYRRWSRDSAGLAEKTSTLTREQRMLAEEMRHLQRAIPIERMDNLGRSMSGIGRTMQLFGAATTIALGAAANSAAQFDTSISSAATQARDIGANASQVQTRIDQLTDGFVQNGIEIDGVIDLMQRFPAAQEEMAASAYEVFSGMDLENQGIIDVAKGMGLLEKANQIAVAGNVSLEEATSAMITTFNNFGSTVEDQTSNLDTMFDIVRFGRMRLSDFNIMMNKIAPAAADAGMKLEDVGGAMAYLTTVMPSQRMVATGISRLIEALRHPDIVAGLKKMGVEAKDASGRMRPLDDILTDIAQQFPAMRTGQQSAAEFFRMVSAIGAGGGRGQIFTAEGRRALSEILTHFDEYIDAQNRIEANQGEFGATLEAQMQSLGVQWNIFLNQVRALVLVIGQEAIPVFAEIGQHIQRFVQWFSQLDPELRRQIVRWAVYAAAGTLVAGILLSVVGSIVTLLAHLRMLGVRFGTARVAAFGLVTALNALAAFTAISIILKVAMGGDPTAMDFLKAAIAGGLLGARFGPAGAVVGAVTIPVIMIMMTDQADKKFRRWEKEHESGFAKRGHEFFGPFRAILPFDVESDRAGFDKEMRRRSKAIRDAQKMPAFEGRQRLGQEQLVEAENKVKDVIERNEKAWKKYIERMKEYRQELENHKEAMEQWRESLADATRQAKEDVMSNLRSMYDQMLGLNREAFGELMQGPWLTSETFDIAKEWGITPRIQDLIKDLRLQNQQFAKWRASLDTLMKRGLPRGLIDELRELGPEQGQPLLDNIIGAKPAQVNALITQWKRKNQQIKNATKMDFVDEIERFRKAGLSMGDAIVNGFQSAQVGRWFDNWIRSTFPNVISNAVAQAVSEWKQANPPPKAPVKPTPPAITKTVTTPQKPNVSTTDNSTNMEINVGPSPDTRDAADFANARALAFAISGAVQGVLGGRR